MKINVITRKLILLSLFIFIFQLYLFSQEIKINQKEGILQEKLESHITFHKFEKFQPDINKVALSRITKLIIHDNKVFILDERQSRIFVFNKEANFLYTIGRPGQGPGDLEYPRDFDISKEGHVYVINSMAKRIEVFSLKGDFKRRIKLNIPEEIFYSRPSCILVSPIQNFLLGYSLSSHLIDTYDSVGTYKRNIIKRDDQIIIPGENLGNCSQLIFFKKERAILHFNYFTGVFTKLSLEGKAKKVFSVFEDFHNNEIKNLKKSIDIKENKPGVRVMNFQLWSNCCIDKDDNIYVFLLLKKKAEKQKLFVFSSEGVFLYWTTIPYFKDTRINKIFCYGDDFFFVTLEEEIIFAKRR